jgi:hypothetical protein
LPKNFRKEKRHSNFWIGLYGNLWVENFQMCNDWIEQLMIHKAMNELMKYANIDRVLPVYCDRPCIRVHRLPIILLDIWNQTKTIQSKRVTTLVCNQGSRHDKLHNCARGFKSQDDCVQFSDFKK